MSDGSLKVERFERNVTTHTVNGAKTEPHAFLRLIVENGNGAFAIEVDAGDWSRMLAYPGQVSPIVLTPVPKPNKGSAA